MVTVERKRSSIVPHSLNCFAMLLEAAVLIRSTVQYLITDPKEYFYSLFKSNYLDPTGIENANIWNFTLIRMNIARLLILMKKCL